MKVFFSYNIIHDNNNALKPRSRQARWTENVRNKLMNRRLSRWAAHMRSHIHTLKAIHPAGCDASRGINKHVMFSSLLMFKVSIGRDAKLK